MFLLLAVVQVKGVFHRVRVTQLPTLLAIYSFSAMSVFPFDVRLDMNLIVSVPEFPYLLSRMKLPCAL